MFQWLKPFMPRSLYSRAALILIVPVVTIQLVVSITFIQRHFEGVTRQMTAGVVLELALLLDQINQAPDLPTAQRDAARLGAALGFEAQVPGQADLSGDARARLDLSGREVIATLRAQLPGLQAVHLLGNPRRAEILLVSDKGPVRVRIGRGRVSASNPHQLLVLMIGTSILMTLIAYVFLRNQLRPIQKLAVAASAYGKGQTVPYRPRGAIEVRAAGAAFLDMRGRIDRQIEQRTMMLSGISHDLRTPLTRLRLGISMLPEDAETIALLGDVVEMQRLVDEFLAFARGDAMEADEDTDARLLVTRIVENAQRAGQRVAIFAMQGDGMVRMRPTAVTRAVENLIGNAVRYGSRAEVSMTVTDRSLRLVVEDDGPGIPKDRREEAMNPFTRLDAARDPNRGGGVGLGLSIAADIARNHGGSLRLGSSDRLGGLKAELVISR